MTSALIAGVSAGVLAAVLALAFMQPLLLTAETYEGAAAHAHGATAAATSAPDNTVQAGADDHAQDTGGTSGGTLLRNAQTVLFFGVNYVGYAFVAAAGMALAIERGWRLSSRLGLVWGLCGFLAFHLAPGFGLPPELPGFSTAALEPRQVWWFGTVGASAAGLALIGFGRNWAAWGAGIIALATPHLIGAPMPDSFASTVPGELGALYAARSLGVALVAWVVLGGLCATTLTRAPLR